MHFFFKNKKLQMHTTYESFFVKWFYYFCLVTD